MILKQSTLFYSKNRIQLLYGGSFINIILPDWIYKTIKQQQISNFLNFIITFNNIEFSYKYIDLYNSAGVVYLKPTKNLQLQFQSYYTTFFKYFWFKLTFKGKGFRVRKFLKSTKMTYNFGRSHWTKIFFNTNFFCIYKIRRQNYILNCVNLHIFSELKKTLKQVKPINHYTKRGLRLKKQVIKKRFGKISQMISSLHF